MINKYIKILFLFFVLLLDSCGFFYKSEFDKEQQIINEYHKRVLQEDGKKFFYIPKEEISILFPNLDTTYQCNSKENYKVLFFDDIGNIIYQCKIYSIDNYCNIKIRCLNLESGEYYITDLSKENIQGFGSSEFSDYIITSVD